MSQENGEVVRAQLQAWNEGDMYALREWYDPDAMIVRGLEGWPEQEPQVGRDPTFRLLPVRRWASPRRESCEDATNY
jgi:ketosteroid isomerase-like protein